MVEEPSPSADSSEVTGKPGATEHAGLAEQGLLLVSLLERLNHAVVPLRSVSCKPRQQKVLVLGAFLAAHELSQGVAAELRAARARNAMRLARHIYEQSLELRYVLADPGRRFEQILSSEVHQQLEIASGINAKARIPKPKRRAFEARDKAARERQNATAERRKKKEPYTASDWGFLPNRREMAHAIGALNEYQHYYPAASWYAHPGIQTYDSYLVLVASGEVRVARRTDNPHFPNQAASLALEQFMGISERANWVLGPVAGLGPRLRAIREDGAASVAMRSAPGATLRALFAGSGWR